MESPPLFAQASDVGVSILPILGWLIALVFAGALAIYLFRRWMRGEGTDPIGFTLADLREMLESGEITDVEFRAARDAMIAQVKRRSASRSKSAKYTSGDDS